MHPVIVCTWAEVLAPLLTLHTTFPLVLTLCYVLIVVHAHLFVVLEKTLESPLDCKEIQPVHSDLLQNGLVGSPWTARRSNQSILKEISPGISLEGMMLRLKLQFFGDLMRRVDSLEKTLRLGGIGGRRRRADRG